VLRIFVFADICRILKKIDEHEKGFLNTNKRAIPTTDKREGEDVRLLLDYGDPVANSHSPPPPEYAVKEVGFSLDYGDPRENTPSPLPPEYAVKDVGLRLDYGDPITNSHLAPPPEYAVKEVGLLLDYGDPVANSLHLRSMMQLKMLDCL
jgi:hypothetical protein